MSLVGSDVRVQPMSEQLPAGRSMEGACRSRPRTTLESRPSSSVGADVIAAFMLTVTSVGFAISFAALIFGGALESGMARAIGSFIVGAGVMALVVARRSGIVPVATFVQEGPAIVMAALVADFVAQHEAGVGDVFVLLVVTMLATSLATGLLGYFGVGALGRCIPTPVVAAFVGGTGWLLFKGGFDVMTNSTLGLADVRDLLRFEFAKLWLPGLVVGLVIWRVGRSQRAPGYVVGLTICACVMGFYTLVAIASSLSAVEVGGWLLGPFPESSGAKLVGPDEFRRADWSGIAATAPGILGVVGLTCVVQLLHLTGIRAELAPRLNIDHELRTSAGANVAAALFGVTPGFQGFGYTVLLHRLGATRRFVALISAVLVIALGVIGVAAVGYVPRFIIGALLVMVGMSLLDDWWRGLVRSASVAERLFGLLVVGVVAWFGLLTGIGLAMLAASLAFIVRYGRVDPVRSVRNRRQVRSRVDRSQGETERLFVAGERLIVLELQGFLFFGSLGTLEDRVRQVTRVRSTVEVLVVDFANVTGADSSGGAVVARLLGELHEEGMAIWLSGLDPAFAKTLRDSEGQLASRVVFSPSVDVALAHAEDQLLAATSQQLTRDLIDLSAEARPSAPQRTRRGV